ncbi:phosphoglycerate dehydrogenase [Homoserinibacter sp. GY 40078]|uniref:phosphoglycerate dehydrogenase n=1 Tax=Homoserinibacter sp. GY 40078 TaxID=2603275 RepID=UPI0011C714DD|nr:phosphoglycerate dehydrogenase [Homoserinibacter sp. GY 40078]TXK19524.1 phosphoglycerate dehydrogenase [Homoserinibacter sp. GY 40078]
MTRVLVTATSLCRERDHPALAPLRDAGVDLVFSDAGRPLTASELAAMLPGIDGVLAGLDEFAEDALAAADMLRVIARFGVGYDRVDLAAAERRGVVVAITPGANASGVAELAIGLMFAVARRIPRLDEQVRGGGWPRSSGIELAGRTLAVLGVGAIGRRVAAAATGIGMHVRGYDPFVPDEVLAQAGVEPGGLDEVLAGSDVLSLHLPLTDETREVIDARRIALLRPGAIVVNTARGGLIDEVAALAALDDGQLFGVGLDAFETEPPTDSVLVGHPHVVSTPHSGAHTLEAVDRTARAAVRNILAVLAGEEPEGRVRAGA